MPSPHQWIQRIREPALTLRRTLAAPWTDRRLTGLAASAAPLARPIAAALRRAVGRGAAPARFAEIEDERRTLLRSRAPLVDGHGGAPGLYDAGQTVAAVCAVSKRPRSAQVLYWLVRETGPRRVLELGTNLGVSGAYLAAALEDNGAGELVSLDASPYRQAIARDVHARLRLPGVSYVPGLFTETLPGVLDERGPFDFFFIDGHHQYQPTLDYFRLGLAAASDPSLFLFDDIRWSPGMWQAWRELRGSERVRLSVDLGEMGLCVTDRAVAAPGPAIEQIYY